MKFRATLLLVMVFAAFISMSSCTKKYTCHCDIVYTGLPGLPDSSTQEYDIQASKSDANTRCTQESGTFDNASVHTVETCYLY